MTIKNSGFYNNVEFYLRQFLVTVILLLLVMVWWLSNHNQ